MPPVFRFAPSPNGYLHLGHAYSALLNFDLARRSGGRFLLRIEDIDPARCRPEFEAAIYRGSRLARHRLGNAGAAAVGASCGLSRGAGETDGLGPDLSCLRKPRRNRQTGGAARGAGAVAARSRRRAALSGYGEVAVAGRERARLLESGAPYALRLDMAAACARAGDLGWTEHGEGPDGETGAVAARPEAWGDVILARKETPTSYHLSVVVDDALQGVTEVVRGAGPVLVDQRAPAAAATARPAAAGLSAPPPRPRRRRAKAVEIDQRPPVCANSGRGGATPADIRRLVGLP